MTRALGPTIGTLAVVLLAGGIAGCVSPSPPAGAPHSPDGSDDALAAPTFQIRGPVAQGLPGFAIGGALATVNDPVLLSDREGSLYLRYFGCDDAVQFGRAFVEHYYVGREQEHCIHAPVLKSMDEGHSWTRLNHQDSGRLAAEAPAAISPPDMAQDASGSLYLVESSCRGGERDPLGEPSCESEAVVTHRSDDGGSSWIYTGNVLQGRFATQSFVAAGGGGHAVYAWKHSYYNKDHPSAVAVRTTFDGGGSFTDGVYLQDNLDQLGKPQFGIDGGHIYIPYSVQTPQASTTARRVSELHVGVSTDGGRTWRDVPTGVRVSNVPDSSACLAGTPSLAVTGEGLLVYAYAEAVPAKTGVTNSGFIVKAIQSHDEGSTWSAPINVSTSPSAILPWIVAGAANQVAISYVANNLEGDPNAVGMWDLRVAVLDLDNGRIADGLAAVGVHVGGLCSADNPCDKSFGNHLSSALLPDGRIVIAYPTDPPNSIKRTELRLAVQESGARISPIRQPIVG